MTWRLYACCAEYQRGPHNTNAVYAWAELHMHCNARPNRLTDPHTPACAQVNVTAHGSAPVDEAAHIVVAQAAHTRCNPGNLHYPLAARRVDIPTFQYRCSCATCAYNVSSFCPSALNAAAPSTKAADAAAAAAERRRNLHRYNIHGIKQSTRNPAPAKCIQTTLESMRAFCACVETSLEPAVYFINLAHTLSLLAQPSLQIFAPCPAAPCHAHCARPSDSGPPASTQQPRHVRRTATIMVPVLAMMSRRSMSNSSHTAHFPAETSTR